MADSWIDAAAAALDRLEQPHAQKKRATVIALVDARLAGRSEETVWDRPDTCSRTVYHQKWKSDETFADVLAEVTDAARRWQDTRALRALQLAAERLQLAAPVAAAKLIGNLNSDDPNVVHRAAVAILTHGGVETAPKSSVNARAQVEVRPLDELTDQELAAIALDVAQDG